MFRRIIMFIMLFLFSQVSYGNIFSYITDAEQDSSYPPGEYVNYTYVIDSWTNDNSPNPCHNMTHCEVSINHRHGSGGEGGDPARVFDADCVWQGATMNDLRDCLQKNGLNLPYKSVTRHVGHPVTQECVGLFYAPVGGSIKNGTLLPGSVCGLSPPPIGHCELPDSLILDHGSISQGELVGNTVSTSMSIDCNMNTSVKVYLSGLQSDLKLSLGGGVTSSIELNGKPISDNGVPLELKSGKNNVNINSTLGVSGPVNEGLHQGQAVLFVALE